VLAFVLIACALAWLAALPLWLSHHGLRSAWTSFCLVVMMFAPLLAAMFVSLVAQRRGFREMLRFVGVYPARPVGRVILFVLVGLIGTIVMVIVGVFLAALLGQTRLDLVHFSGLIGHMRALGIKSMPVAPATLVAVQLAVIPLAAVFNSVATVGEEFGWRGWLLPSLRPLGRFPALVISGAIWGAWHTPVILLGYNFGQPNLLGIALMVVGCMLLGVLFGWLRLASGSLWPSVAAHGAFNASAGIFSLLAASGAPANLIALNPLGWVTWIVMFLLICVLALTKQLGSGTPG
jgi:membrane protease YdiL (CAAX protease family)